MRGRLITLEGGEGAGKSTAIDVVVEWLREQGSEPVVTREPGGTPAAERIREVLLDPDSTLSPLGELLLMFAARNENLESVIRPALASGRDVVCDRFTDASRAYQGGGRELGAAAVEALADLVHGDLQPDLTILLDIPVSQGLKRVAQRGAAPDRFETTTPDFLERVRQAYLDQARREPQRIAVIDASVSLEKVRQAVRETLSERMS